MRERITFDQCDTPDEVCDWLNKIRLDQDLMEAKIEQLNKDNGILKRQMYSRVTKSWVTKLLNPKKKKGSALMKTIVSLAILVLITVASFGAYKTTDINYEIASNPEMLSQYLRDSFANITSETYIFTPGSEPSSADTTEGMVYYDSSANLLYVCLDGTNWTSIDTGAVSGFSLDASYNEGSTIDVDTAALTFTTSLGDDNVVMALVQNDSTNDGATLTIVSASDSTQASLDITSTAGYDIQGTGDTWEVSYAGIGDFVGLIVGAEDIVLENGAKILNVDDTQIKFIEDNGAGGDEDFSIDFAANALVLKSGSSVASIDFGPIDDLIGVGTIVFDDAASTITLTSTSTTDLTISQATADQDASLILQSSGVGTDALSLIASAASINVDSADNLDIDVEDDITVDTAGGSYTLTTIGGDIVIDASDKSITLDAAEADEAAINIDSSGGIDADVALSISFKTSENTADAIELVATAGGIDLTAAGSSTEDLNLVCTSGSTTLTAGEDIATAITISAGTGGIDITADGATAKDLDLTCTNGSVNITAGEDVEEGITITNSTGGINITADGAADKDLDLVCTNGSANLSGGEAAANAVVISAGAGGIDITSAGATMDIDITATGGTVLVVATEAGANQFKVDAQGTIAEGSGDAIVLETTNGGVMIQADHADNGDIDLVAGDDIVLTATGNMVLTVGGVARVVDDDILSFGTTDNIQISYDEATSNEDNLKIVGPVDFETTYCQFRSNPVVCEDDGTAVNGDNADTNLMAVDGWNFEYYLMGDGQTILIPSMTNNGLNVRLDETGNDGIEMTEGITTRAKSVFTTNTDSFYFKLRFRIAAVAEMDIVAVGFRKLGAYNADMYGYTDFSCMNVDNGTINIEHELSDGGLTSSDSGNSWTDGQTKTLEVRIDGDGESTYYVDGTEITNTIEFDWTENDTVIPFFHILGDNTAACAIELVTWECGIYNQ